MHVPLPQLLCLLRLAVFGAVILAVALGPTHRLGHGQSADEPDPTGGLRSRGMVPSAPAAGQTREELVRQWDLDGNGTIDASEAAVARARMRRGRVEMQLNTGIDPLTGRPRVTAEEAVLADEEVGSELPPEMPEEPAKRSPKGPSLPGTRVPEPAPATSGTSSGPRPPRLPTAAGGTPGQPSSATRPGPAATRPGSATGGIRAGAPAARPGYGSLGPRSDLNAGMPRPDPTMTRPGSSIPGGRMPIPRGGLLPSTRPGVGALPRPTTPAAPSPRPPRVTDDEIGGF